MIEWNEYIEKLLSKPDSIDGIVLSFDGGKTIVRVPPIIKASIFMLDKIIEKQGGRQIIVFPERQQIAFVFALARIIHNIFQGKIEKRYAPESFIPGEKLKLGNAVVEYLGIEERDGKKYIMLHMADLDICSTAITMLPMLQKTNTKRPISKHEKYVFEKKKILRERQSFENSGMQINTLLEYKTHITSSVYYVSSVASVKEQMLMLRMCGNKVSNLLLMGQTNYEGKITNIGTGQLTGIAAIVLASDLYAVNSSLECGNPAQSVIVDISNINLISSQLDALDELLRKKVPMIFITDIANSFDFTMFIDRGFNIWRWNENSLTSDLYNASETIADKKIENCAKQKVQYVAVNGKEISEAAKLLAKHRREPQEQSALIMKLYEKLSNISFNILRETVPVNDFECNLMLKDLNDCRNILDMEKTYLSEETYEDYNQVIQNYIKIYSYGYVLVKNKALCDVFYGNRNKKITIVIPEKTDKKRVESFWKSWIQRHMLHIELSIYFPTEYYGSICNHSDLTIVVGWLRRAIMRKIIFSYNTKSYVVLLYDCEKQWKDCVLRKWSRSLADSNNKDIIRNSLNSEQVEISTSRYEAGTKVDIEGINEEDELEEINLVLRENKYKQFISGDSRKNGQVVEAIPINYVGGFLAFYQIGHELVSATQIIMDKADKIEIISPESLSVGDFIVVRESGRDIVKDMADVLLKNENKENLRELASKWREVIAIELLFTTENVFFQKMSEAGCKKGIATMKRWIEDEGMIAPRDKEDLQCIAEVSGSEVLKELLDDVFEAANTIRSAHIQAGKILSNQLKVKLVDVLRGYGNIDPFNFWEPIEIDVEGIGIVKVLKIIDKGNIIQVDASDTNRLIEE